MNRRVSLLVQCAMIAAMYAAVTHLQNVLLPGSASWAVQVRISEALCVLAFLTPAAIPGLTLGCLAFNLTGGAGLPLDALVGSAASFLASASMYALRRVTVRRVPVIGLLMPALWNALLVGWELTVYMGGAFRLNALYVALGELVAVLLLGLPLLLALQRRGLDKRIFGKER